MTVQENVEYGLRVKKLPKAERRGRAGEALAMVRLHDYGPRKPAQLSAASASASRSRAIVNRPRMLLLDEPLGALDLKLRQEMQVELKQIQARGRHHRRLRHPRPGGGADHERPPGRSLNGGQTWTQPTYTGYSARHCLGQPGDGDRPCSPDPNGPIGTLPDYEANGLVSDGDPAVAFGPKPGRSGGFSWASGTRLYYANLASNFPGQQAFKGAEAIAVSHSDDLVDAAAGRNDAWSAPVIASRQSSAQFSDKEQIWADNASTSPFFGNAYVCYADFRGNGQGFTNQPLVVLTSRDGGATWTQNQGDAGGEQHRRPQRFRPVGLHRADRLARRGLCLRLPVRLRRHRGGRGRDPDDPVAGRRPTWTQPAAIFSAFDTCNFVEASIERCVEDGVGGARSDLSPAPSVDIANGAPDGAGATDRIVLTWVDGRDGLNREHVFFSTSDTRGATWSAPVRVERRGDRGYYSAPAIFPDGADVWLVYNAFTTPFRTSAVGPGNARQLVGVLLHANAGPRGVGAFTQVDRGASGDARASPRTTSRRSSSATTSTRRRRGPPERRSGTTCATARTARRSIGTARPCTTRRSPRARRRPSRRRPAAPRMRRTPRR